MADFNQTAVNPTELPPEYAAEIEALQRKQALAALLQKQSMSFSGAQSSGPVAAKTSPLSWLANGLSGYLANKTGEDASAGIQGVRGKYQAAAQGDLQALQNLPEEQAIKYGQASKFPGSQAVGKALFEARNKRAGEVIGALGRAGDVQGATQIGATGQIPLNYTPKSGPEPELRTTVIDGKTIPYLIQTDKNGVKTGHGLGGQVINIDQTTETAAAKAIGGKVPDVLESARESVINAQDSITNSNRILQLSSDPAIIAGFAANQQLGLASLAAKMGFTGNDATTKTQELVSALAKSTLEASKQLKGAISDKEGPFLAAAASGGIQYTPEALQHLAKLSIAVNHNKLLNARSQWTGASLVGGRDGQPNSGAQMFPLPRINYTTPEADGGYVNLPGGYLRYEGNYTPKAPTKTPVNPNQLTPEQLKEYNMLISGQK